VALTRAGDAVIEKKVKLPVRWIQGFSEVQAYQPDLQLRLEVPAAEARRFIRTLPRGGAPKRPSFVTQSGRTIRVSQREGRGAIRVHGTHRVAVLEALMGAARSLRIWADDDVGTSAWEITFRTGRFFLMLSPEVYRGFSGEGQALETLGAGRWQEALPKIRAQLSWQNEIDVDALAATAGATPDEVRGALALWGCGRRDVCPARHHGGAPRRLPQVRPLSGNGRRLSRRPRGFSRGDSGIQNAGGRGPHGQGIR